MTLGSINAIGTASATSLDYNPNVTYLEDGSYLVVYEAEAGLYDDLYIERYSADGTLLTSGQLLNFAPYASAIDLRTPRITDLGNGEFVLNFDSGAALDNTAFIFDYDFSTGSTLTLTSQSSATPQAISEMQTLALPTGGYMNVWYERVDTGASLEYRIFYETLSVTGVGNGPVEVTVYTSASTGLLTTWDPQIAYIGDNASGNPEYRIFYTGINASNDQFLRSKEIDPVNGTVSAFETFNIFDDTATITKHQLIQEGTDEFYLLYEVNGITHVSTSSFAASIGSNELNLELYEGFAAKGHDGNIYVIGQVSAGTDQFDLVVKKIEFDGSTTTISTVQKLAEGTTAAQFQDFHADFDPNSSDMTFVWRDTSEGLQQFTVSEAVQPTGEAKLVGFRALGQEITVDISELVDPYGIDMSTLQITWFEDGLPSFNGFGDTFFSYTSGSVVTALVSYESEYGYQELLLTDETAPLEDFFDLTSYVSVSGQMVVGETLTANIDKLLETNLDYQLVWFSGTNVVQLGGTTLDLDASMVGEDIDVLVQIIGPNGAGFSANGGDDYNYIIDVDSGALVEQNGVSLTGTSDDDVLMGSAGADYIRGMFGDDEITGGADDDDLFGFSGNDTIYGGSGADLLNGAGGDDEIYGGAGNDLINAGIGADAIDGGDGIDMLKFDGTGTGVYVDLASGAGLAGQAFGDVYANIENVTATNAGDIIIGDEENNRILGGDNGTALDQLFGGGGNDWISGQDGNDLIVGGSGNNRLEGGNDDDMLISGSDSDILIGGAGADQFFFGDEVDVTEGISAPSTVQSTGNDAITDFAIGTDQIVIDDANANAFGDLSIFAVGSDSFVSYGTGTVVVLGTATTGVSDLASTDFIFA